MGLKEKAQPGDVTLAGWANSIKRLEGEDYETDISNGRY